MKRTILTVWSRAVPPPHVALGPMLALFLCFTALAQPFGEVVVYEHANYGGRSRTLGVGEHSFKDWKPASVRVPKGLVAILHESENPRVEIKGPWVDVLEDHSDLSQFGLAGRVSFASVFQATRPGYFWARNSMRDGRFVAGHWERSRPGGDPANTTAVAWQPESRPPPVGGGVETGSVDRPRVVVDNEARHCAATKRVNSVIELRSVLQAATDGSQFGVCIIIPRNANWKMEDPCIGRDEFGRCYPGGPVVLNVPPGVTLRGERGPLGSRPVLRSPYLSDYCLVHVSKDVRIEGIHFLGPTNGERREDQPSNSAICVLRDALQKAGLTIIADNEFNEWSYAAVNVASTWSHPPTESHAPRERFKIFTKEDAGLVRIERNYIHHNARNAKGYGVSVGNGAFAIVMGNVFDFNRHAVESPGSPHSGYIARFNYVLQGGFEEGGFNPYYNQHFDVHGSNNGYGGVAGDYFEIASNTIRGEQEYYAGIKTRPAFMLRGKPQTGAYFNGNVVVHDDLDEAVSLKASKGATGWGEDHEDFNFHASDNRFDTDYSLEIASGDFDSDGRTDVFLANGTAWFFSSGGVGPWEFLYASTQRKHQLAFADIDNDGVTDVLVRDSGGNLGFLKSGKIALANFTRLPVPITELRFGDFDADRKTDMFYSLANQWYVWYGRTRTWTPTANSEHSISTFLFGEFDDVPGTDIVSTANGSYSSSAIGRWTELPSGIRIPAGAVAADFDGNGKTDIAFGSGQRWFYSRDAGFAPVALRNGARWPTYPTLNRMLIGPFDGGTKAKVLTFELRRPGGLVSLDTFVAADRFVLWRGLGSDQSFVVRSSQNMR